MQTVAVQILPPQPDRPDLHFDNFQFENRPLRVVSKHSRIAFSDFIGHMSIKKSRQMSYRRGYYPTPTFAFDNDKLKRVLAISIWRGRHGTLTPPENLSLDALKKMSEASLAIVKKRAKRAKRTCLSPHQKQILDRHILAATSAGSPLTFKLKIVWLCWRLGYTSPVCAEECQTTARTVRAVLCRLVKIARHEGMETFETKPHLRNRRK